MRVEQERLADLNAQHERIVLLIQGSRNHLAELADTRLEFVRAIADLEKSK
jgi:prefoldin subunit 5